MLTLSIAQLRPPYFRLYPFQGHQITSITVSLISAMLFFVSPMVQDARDPLIEILHLWLGLEFDWSDET